MARLTPAVVRTLDILELFIDGPTTLSAADVVRETELPRSTVHELLTTLTSREYLQKNEDTGQYTLGVRLLHLGNAYAERFDLLGAANVVARELSGQLKETVSVAIRQGTSVFYLAKIEARTISLIPSAIGQRLPASATGVGKALLSALSDDELRNLYPDSEPLPVLTEHSIPSVDALRTELNATRLRGYALDRAESALGLYCAAACVRDVEGAVVAAISVSVPQIRWEQRDELEWAQPVIAAAGQLSAQLGYRGPNAA